MQTRKWTISRYLEYCHKIMILTLPGNQKTSKKKLRDLGRHIKETTATIIRNKDSYSNNLILHHFNTNV